MSAIVSYQEQMKAPAKLEDLKRRANRIFKLSLFNATGGTGVISTLGCGAACVMQDWKIAAAGFGLGMANAFISGTAICLNESYFERKSALLKRQMSINPPDPH